MFPVSSFTHHPDCFHLCLFVPFISTVLFSFQAALQPATLPCYPAFLLALSVFFRRVLTWNFSLSVSFASFFWTLVSISCITGSWTLDPLTWILFLDCTSLIQLLWVLLSFCLPVLPVTFLFMFFTFKVWPFLIICVGLTSLLFLHFIHCHVFLYPAPCHTVKANLATNDLVTNSFVLSKSCLYYIWPLQH